MTPDNVQALPLGTQLGDYRLDAVIGQGGFGITYRAFDSQLAKIVAIKEYLPVEFAVRGADRQVVPRGGSFAEDFAWGLDRFLDEARALARFRHPHIVPVLRFIEANGTAYTVMEFEDGRSIAEMLREPGRRLPPPDVRRLTEGLLSGLAAVHAQGFLHRDIKPSNIIIRRDGMPILIDFGAARLAIGGRSRTLTSVLTPQYAPIEQYAMDGKQGPWSDIYSAGAVLYRAIAGEPPPEAASRVGQDPYKPLTRTQADRFDQNFLGAIDRALSFTADNRPQTIEAWRALFGTSLPAPAGVVTDAPTQKMELAQSARSAQIKPVQRNVSRPELPARAGPSLADAPRLGGVTRGEEVVPPPAPPVARRRLPFGQILAAAIIAVAAAGLLLARPQFESLVSRVLALASVAPPVEAPAAPAPVPEPPSTPAVPAPSAISAQKVLIDQAQRAAAEARALFEPAKEAADAARTMAGEARIVAARAARPGLENAEKVGSDDGTVYVGQVSDDKQRQGLGVADFKDGARQAGEWKENSLNGLGVDRQADGGRYEGQWRAGHPQGLGVQEKPGVDRSEGNFVAGKLEGYGLRRSFSDPLVTLMGEWHAGSFDGPGIETVGDKERYEGGFRAGKRHGYGQVTGPGDKVQSGRWNDGTLVESAP